MSSDKGRYFRRRNVKRASRVDEQNNAVEVTATENVQSAAVFDTVIHDVLPKSIVSTRQIQSFDDWAITVDKHGMSNIDRASDLLGNLDERFTPEEVRDYVSTHDLVNSYFIVGTSFDEFLLFRHLFRGLKTISKDKMDLSDVTHLISIILEESKIENVMARERFELAFADESGCVHYSVSLHCLPITAFKLALLPPPFMRSDIPICSSSVESDNVLTVREYLHRLGNMTPSKTSPPSVGEKAENHIMNILGRLAPEYMNDHMEKCVRLGVRGATNPSIMAAVSKVYSDFQSVVEPVPGKLCYSNDGGLSCFEFDLSRVARDM